MICTKGTTIDESTARNTDARSDPYAQIGLLNYMATMHFLSGEIPEQLGNSHFVHVPYNTFPTSDGYIIIAVITDNFWVNLMELLDLPELDTEENKGQPGRMQNREMINQKVSEAFQTNSQAYWINKLREARIPCAPVNNLAQALTNEQVVARNMVVEIEHSQGGTVKMPGNPIKLSDTYADSYTSPPLLGEHTTEVLMNLGKTEAEIADYFAAGVI